MSRSVEDHFWTCSLFQFVVSFNIFCLFRVQISYVRSLWLGSAQISSVGFPHAQNVIELLIHMGLIIDGRALAVP